MSRFQSPIAELDRRRDYSVVPSPFLSLDPVDDFGARETHTTFIVLEPTESSPQASAVAAEVADRLRGYIDANRALTATAAILNAVESVNHWLLQANALRSPDRRAYFGFTCLMARGDEVYIAQAAPSQVLIGQEGEIYAFPGLETWRAGRLATEPESTPLGMHTEIQPDLYHTRVEPGDLVVLCSSGLARVIEREPQTVFAGSDSDAAMAHLQELALRYAVHDAYAAALVVPRHSSYRSEREHDILRRVGSWCCHLLPEETAERIRRRTQRPRNRLDEVDLEPLDVHTLHYPEDASSVEHQFESEAWGDSFEGTTRIDLRGARLEAGFDETQPGYDEPIAERRYWDPQRIDVADDEDPAGEAGKRRGFALTELLAGAILALSAAVVGVWQLAINRDHPMSGPRDDGTVGLPRLNRYDHSVQMPDLTGVRRRLPRTPISRFTGVVSLALLVMLAAGLFISVRNSHERERAAQIEATLQTAMGQRQQANEANDPATSQAFLLAARQTVHDAQDAGLDAGRASQELTAINADLDKVLHVERVSNVQNLGGVPAAPAGVSPRVFFGNGQLYVFSDALYRLDDNGTALVRLIGSNDKVGGNTVGMLQGAAWADGAPVVFDGSAAYVFDPPTATWNRQQLGTFGSPYTGIVSVYSYSGNLYLLSPGTSQIMKFAAGNYQSQPEDWTAGVAAAEIAKAVDFEIDGRIYLLTKDGQIVTFFRSAVESTITPAVSPPISNAVGLSAQPDRPYFYVADDQGRIIRLARDGKLVQQFMSAAGSPSFANIRDFAVDDALSTAYILTDSGLLSVRLPGPPR
jgi:hypothetical protein